MNVRKPVNYSTMFAALDTLMTASLPQMELYCEIGRLVSSRPEKGAAVAAAEHLHGAYPEIAGFSPRNLRRMREFYRTYSDIPKVLAEAMTIGWTQNVTILEADLTIQEKVWYIQAVQEFGWSKLELSKKIRSGAHREVSLDLQDKVCYTEENSTKMRNKRVDKNTLSVPWEYLQKSNGQVCDEGLSKGGGTGASIPRRVRCHQHRGHRQSGLSPGPPQVGRIWYHLYWKNGPPTEEQRLQPRGTFYRFCIENLQ